ALTLVAVFAAYIGWLGAWAKGVVLQVNAALDDWLPSFDKLGKVSGVFITLASGAFAIYQKFYFAEFNMHSRLREFLERVDARLKDSNKHIANAVLRPSPDRKFESPIFTDETLNPVLKQMKWGKRPRADQSLEATLKELESQLDLWNERKREYEQRQAQVCLLKGAIAAARAAKEDGPAAQKDNVDAQKYFREAFDLSNQEDLEALEYIGHQQVRLGDHEAALETFREIAAKITTEGPSLTRARALKFQAERYECRRQPNLFQAKSLVKDAVDALPPEALHIEKAEIHEMRGRVCANYGFQNKATASYTEAQFWYQRIVEENNSDNEDVLIAKAGLKRVFDAVHRIRMKQDGTGTAPPAPPTAPLPNGSTTPPNAAEDEPSEDAEAVGRDGS